MKILILANFGMGLYKFRKELIEELLIEKNTVFISLPRDEYITKLEKLGCNYIETHVDRRGTNPLTDLKLLITYIKMIKHIKPDVVLTYTIKPNVYGGIACRITRTCYKPNITGLGSSSEKEGLLKKITLALYKIALKRTNCVFFQNELNRQLFLQKKIINNNSTLIPGSGVNLKDHRLEEYPMKAEITRFLFIGRIMKAKGIDELLEAAIKVKEKYPNIEFDIVGFCEEEYSEKLMEYVRAGIINYHGQQDDIHSYIKNSVAIILPSYHEGTANILLEAASTGRPVLASKVSGCIETFDEGISGFGFEVKNVESLVATIFQFIELPYEKKKAMGLAGRKKMELEFDRQIVVKAYMKEINSIKFSLACKF